MSRSCKELKQIARKNLNGNYGIPMGAILIAEIISLAAELPFSMLQKNDQPIAMTIIFYAADLLIILLSGILSAGIIRLHLLLARKQSYSLNSLFYGFKNHPDRFIIVEIFLLIANLIGALPVIAGVVVLYMLNRLSLALLIFTPLAVVSLILLTIIRLWYALVLCLILDHPQMSATQALKQSRLLIKGHKGRLFYIYLSFIGMQILCILSLGIGLLWVLPYQSQTLANFYLDVVGELAPGRI